MFPCDHYLADKIITGMSFPVSKVIPRYFSLGGPAGHKAQEDETASLIFGEPSRTNCTASPYGQFVRYFPR